MFNRFIPTPSVSSIAVGPLTIHLYALCIITGVAVAIWLGDKRYRAFGGNQGVVTELAIWVVPAGVIGGRLYHVITSPENFFGKHGSLLNIIKIWEGGLGIWGAIALGFAAAYWRYQKLAADLPFSYFMDALAPGLLIAQGIGRFGNWFNGELFGSPSKLPWALEIPTWLRPTGYEQFATYHPTFLYEAICNFILAALLLSITGKMKSGSLFYVYVAGYCSYRFFIEGIRIDSAHNFAGLRLNQWVALILGSASVAKIIKIRKSLPAKR